jgi:hypothetical protein
MILQRVLGETLCRGEMIIAWSVAIRIWILPSQNLPLHSELAMP